MADDPKKPDFSDVVSGGSSKPDFSDVVSGSSSTAPAPAEGAGRPNPDTMRIYVVQSGDSLSKIAKRFYGDANAWKPASSARR